MTCPEIARRGTAGRCAAFRRRSTSLIAVIAGAALGVVAGCGGSGDADDDSGANGGSTRTPAPAGTAPVVPTDGTSLSAAERDAVNRAVGLMGRYDYEGAADILSELADRRPDWIANRVNLAIAVMNRQGDGDEQRALDLLRTALDQAPDDPRALYVSGLLELRGGEIDAAARKLGRVVEIDPADPYAAYFHGQAIESTDAEAAVAEYERALRLEPYLRSAAYRASSVLRRLGQREASADRLELFQRLDGNPQARAAEFVYTRMGDKATVIAPGSGETAEGGDVVIPSGPVFAEPVAIGVAAGGGTPLVADLDGDGRFDLFMSGRGDDGNASPSVFAGEGTGWTADPEWARALLEIDGVNTALLDDLDDDGDVDAYLLMRGGNRLLLADADAPGGWVDATEASGTAGDALNSVDGAMVDADHDGDLDLVVINADGPDELFSHDVDGRFRSLGEASGLAASGAGSRRVLVEDLDADRDLDLVVLRDDGILVRINDRLWDWRDAPEFAAIADVAAVAAVTADADADGRPELYVAAPDGTVRRWSIDDGWSAAPPAATDAAPGAAAGSTVSFAVRDVDGDGVVDLVSVDRTGQPRLDAVPGGAGGPASVTIAVDAPRWTMMPGAAGAGPSVVVVDGAGELSLHAAGAGRWPFVAVDVRGRTDAANSLRSNAAGIGTRFAARAGDRWIAGRFLRGHSGPGQGTMRRSFGLGGRDRLDFIELEWPDGVFQSEVHAAADPAGPMVDLSAGRLVEIDETQRQLSSCPVVFAWNGSEWEFVSDVLGVGGLGYLVEPGVFAPPRPRERFLMPRGLPVARDGRWAVKLHEPMEEACYLDHAAFDVWDVPPGWDVVPDERLDLAPPVATGEPRFFRESEERRPVRAINDRGDDVVATILECDDDAAPTPPIDARFIGSLTDEHVLTITFDDDLAHRGAGGDGVPTLVVDGWVEYPYSQTNFAAWQAGVDWAAPTVEAQTSDGRWITIADRVGYPAGMPRRMSLPLLGLPEGCRTIRIRTRLEVYWDRVAVVPTVGVGAVRPAPVHHRLEPTGASLRRSGFPARTTGPQRRPMYSYADRRPFADMRALRGFHTAEGSVLALLAGRDDAVAVFGPGEEVTVETPAPPAAPAGWSRRVVLDVAGWCKDMDLFTGDGETIEPMPSRGDGRTAEAVRLDADTRTRFRSGG